jgi:D-glycero-alpha-D-manno-heptose-7-phosphate kinase
MSGKICGAGGGGCLICFGDPPRIPAIRDALAAGGARILDFTIEREGLIVGQPGDRPGSR